MARSVPNQRQVMYGHVRQALTDKPLYVMENGLKAMEHGTKQQKRRLMAASYGQMLNLTSKSSATSDKLPGTHCRTILLVFSPSRRVMMLTSMIAIRTLSRHKPW